MGEQNLFRPIIGITDEASQGLISGDLCEVNGGLYEILFRKVPKSVCKTIEKLFWIRKFYSIGLRRKDRLFGNVTIALQSDRPINKNSIETVVNQASVVLEKREHQQKIIQMNKNLEQRIQERTSEVQRLLTQKDAFIYQLGHDLKTPLGPLIQLLPILETKTDDPDCMEILKVLKRNVSYINSLVSKTLRFMKLTDSDASMKFEQVDLRREIQDVLSRFSEDLEKKNISTSIDGDVDVVIEADKHLLAEVFDHLIDNAVKYSNNACRIDIEAEKKDDDILVSISDNGIGLSDQQIKYVFDEYFKADSSRHYVDNSGLGLSICKRIIENHGGHIQAKSKGIGKGSTFTLTLPLKRTNK